MLAHHGSWLSSPPASGECASVDTDALAVVVGAAWKAAPAVGGGTVSAKPAAAAPPAVPAAPDVAVNSTAALQEAEHPG